MKRRNFMAVMGGCVAWLFGGKAESLPTNDKPTLRDGLVGAYVPGPDGSMIDLLNTPYEPCRCHTPWGWSDWGDTKLTAADEHWLNSGGCPRWVRPDSLVAFQPLLRHTAERSCWMDVESPNPEG